ncbi:MAG TPA: hypothetical protein VFJ14_00260 [Nocardioidaceae bacterium]|nr:hypothetical protein [Nocardioidaceae bacterium]
MSADNPLMTARARVLHDLQARRLDDASSVSALEESVSHRGWWLSQWPDGREFVAGLVAQDVQDALFDNSTGRWPLCTACDILDEHSLTIEPELGADPHWVCPESGIVVGPLGRLP